MFYDVAVADCYGLPYMREYSSRAGVGRVMRDDRDCLPLHSIYSQALLSNYLVNLL
jgi:hypothetical protein